MLGGITNIVGQINESVDWLSALNSKANIASPTFTGIVTMVNLLFTTLPEYVDETAAVTGGLPSGRVYKTPTGELRIKL